MELLPRNQEIRFLCLLLFEGLYPSNDTSDKKEVQVYERNEEGNLKFIQPIDLDFLPDNPCTSPSLQN